VRREQSLLAFYVHGDPGAHRAEWRRFRRLQTQRVLILERG